MTALVDLDGLIYRAGFSKDKDLIQTIDILEYLVDSIITNTQASQRRLFLTGPKSFRKELYTDYKSNRVKDKPKYYHDLREYALRSMGAELADEGLEADDMCGIHQTDTTIICSGDKDMLTIPGNHYRLKRNWSDNHHLSVTLLEAEKNFWYQMLVGDTIDTVEGLAGIGDKKANKALLDEYGMPKTNMREIVEELYKNQFKDGWYDEFHKNATLLFIKRDTNKTYQDYY